MLHRIREPFGKAGLIVAVIAMVAALVGGAYAASALTGKQKKEVKKIAKKFAGKNGAQGPAGPQGPKGDTGAAGANGKDGAPGTDGTDGAPGTDGTDGAPGTDGTDGENVTVIPLSSGDTNCPLGGSKFTNGTGTAYACNGTGGGGGLPETMKGYWEVIGESGVILAGPEWSVTQISFPFPPETVPTETLLIDFDATEEEKDKCPGTSENPEAAVSGVLCLYVSFGTVTLLNAGPTEAGAGLFFSKTSEGIGSWAVKAVDAA